MVGGISFMFQFSKSTFSCSSMVVARSPDNFGTERAANKGIKAPTHNKRSGVWVWAYRENGPGPGRTKRVQI